MPIATPEAYGQMLDTAKSQGFAFPAVNCVGSEAVNAALNGFAEAGSDGIIQISTGGAEFASGLGVKDMVTGAVALAEFTHVVAARYPVTVALHTDHCPKDKLDTYVRPLLAISRQRVDAAGNPLFNSHMWDGSAIPVDENLDIAVGLLHDAAAANVILEIPPTRCARPRPTDRS
jgi:fructose-bisphosphate aldolase, class II